MIQVHLFKRRRRKVKVDPKLGGQWKEKEKVPMLGGQWKVPSLVANGRWKKNPFHLFSFSPQPNLLKLSIFLFDFKILLYHVLGHYLRVSFLLWSINYDCAPQCNQSFAFHCRFDFNRRSNFFFSSELWALRMVASYGPPTTQANEESPPETTLDLTLT